MERLVGRLTALEIETAESEYLTARVAALGELPGNPFNAELCSHDNLRAFLVRSTPSPMMNRICGDSRVSPDALSSLVAWFTARRCVPAIPLPFQTGKPALREQIGEQSLRRLSGWTHMQLAAPISHLPVRQSPLKVEELTADTVEAFTTIHAEAFHTAPKRQAVNQASFSGMIAGVHAKGFLVRVDGKAAAGAIVYFASNGIAYLGTAATRQEFRGHGCHAALIECRIAAARKHGSSIVAATAVTNSQSRRNLERLGLAISHVQALYCP